MRESDPRLSLHRVKDDHYPNPDVEWAGLSALDVTDAPCLRGSIPVIPYSTVTPSVLFTTPISNTTVHNHFVWHEDNWS